MRRIIATTSALIFSGAALTACTSTDIATVPDTITYADMCDLGNYVDAYTADWTMDDCLGQFADPSAPMDQDRLTYCNAIMEDYDDPAYVYSLCMRTH